MRYLSHLPAPLLFVLGLFLWSEGIGGAAWPAEVTRPWAYLLPTVFLALGATAVAVRRGNAGLMATVDFLLAFTLAYELLRVLNNGATAGGGNIGFLFCLAGVAVAAWQALESLGERGERSRGYLLLVPAVFGIALIYFWQVAVAGFGIAPILLPPPSAAARELAAQAGTLWADFRQTVLKGVLAGFFIGSGLGFAVAVLTDRVPFLQRGLLPLGNMASAVPIIGMAPIMVMLFGFDWESKAAVIVVMTFFPMLINAIAGLAAADHMQRDLMRSYGAGYWQTLAKLRLPAALPFVFNALKINSTLAMIGGIVAEFFGSHTVGLGFRINTMAGRNDFATVWAAIAIAALAGSLFYGLLALAERGLTFWHPSYRAKARHR
jgi:NitT/TauT family transport system permease protein